MCNKEPTLRIDKNTAGHRLDVALALLFPSSGARARRRLWDSHKVLVNGKSRPAGCMVREGDEICVRPQGEERAATEAPAHAAPCPPCSSISPCSPDSPFPLCSQSAQGMGELPPCLLRREGNLLFLYKPAGLHSSRLEGRGGPSLEDLLPQLCAPQQQLDAKAVLLANRLDCGTSGIVVAACDAHSLQQWRRMENAALCEKRYLALLYGHLPAPVTVRRELDSAKRRITRALATESNDPLRHSRFTPLGYLSPEQVNALYKALLGKEIPEASLPTQECTLAACTIAKGARHQIRVHALSAGFPLWGDALYTRPDIPPAPQDGKGFFLHHGTLSLPGVRVDCEAAWQSGLPKILQESISS